MENHFYIQNRIISTGWHLLLFQNCYCYVLQTYLKQGWKHINHNVKYVNKNIG